MSLTRFRKIADVLSWVARVGFITGSSELLRPHVQSWRPPLTPAQPPSAVGVKAASGRRHRDLAILKHVLEPFTANVPWTQARSFGRKPPLWCAVGAPLLHRRSTIVA